MIRLWLSRDASVSIREQLVAQILLGILSRKLTPGEKLPSVRALARLLKIHGNTVNAVYRDLAKRGWVQAQAGSGVFVSEVRLPSTGGGLDELARVWIAEARAHGYSIQDLHLALDRQAQQIQPERIIVIDPDPDLARVLANEISLATGHRILSASSDDISREIGAGTYVLINSGQASRLVPSIGSVPFRLIRLKSMEDVLDGKQRPKTHVLIAVVSRSESILKWASMLLSALGFHSDRVLLRDPHTEGWHEGLGACDIVAADIISATELPDAVRPYVFHVVSDETLEDIRQLVTVQKVS